jgi:predicted metal-dependent enzyme (double-stranded beta helix superfamily)
VSALGGRQLDADAASLARARGRDLSREELERFARDLGSRPQLWRTLAVHAAAERQYHELLRDEHLSAWVICWMDGHDTGFHDHDLSAGAVAVVAGRVREQRLVLGGPPLDRGYGAGEAFSFSPADIHRVRHDGTEPTVTIHVYSPPLARMGAYHVDDEGVLRRRTMASDEELRPLS